MLPLPGHPLPSAAAALLAGLLLAPAVASAASPARKACVVECNAARLECVAQAEANDAALRAGCAAAPDPRACEAQAKRLAKAGKKACQGARKACKRCCKAPQPSCVQAPELPVASGAFPAPDRAALPAALEEAGFPPGPDGRGFTVVPLPDGELFIDPADRSPVSAAGECAEAVLACFAPPERNLAGCLAAVPACRAKPWKGDDPACCPARCGERYQAWRREGFDEAAAFAAALFAAPSCMPGLDGNEEAVR
jgi:hypothetical protein